MTSRCPRLTCPNSSNYPLSTEALINAKKPAQFLSGLFDINPATSYFPTTESCSIIGSNRLNFRVRDGNGCDPVDRITGKLVNSES